ncbi:MAG: serine/threonine protein kinase, partial [Candidatus Obscuribacterales bacterium]|nr:serine/threonine protein kinase [Candidatus Obscuribacterales bacterium]
SRVNIKRSIPWSQVNLIQSVSSSSDPANSKIVLRKTGGGDVDIPINQLKPEFVEQFLLACKMWAQSACDLSLEQLQNNLRIEAHSNSSASYTDLWEEELGRRFCPTAFIPLEPGRALRNNSLKVISQLATGGLSALYLCQLEGKQLVVLKESMIPASSEEGVRDKAKELFEREAQLLMKIDHPGIVHILDCFAEGDRNYMLLEYINGVDLRQLVLQNGAQKEIDVIEWAIQIATTLKYLHEKDPPLIHRDLTPDNIVMGNDGKVTIVDFGAANEFIGNATGTFVGKHAYIAPEQMRGKATTHSDIYAFGCTMNFLLTGQEPEALSPSIPREINPSVSEELSALVESCTQMEANDRYQSVAQLLPVLRRMAAQSLVT